MGLEVKPGAWCADMLDAFAPSLDANPWGWGTAAEVLGGAFAFEVDGGACRALVAVRPVVRSAGTRLDVVGVVSIGERLRAADFDAAMLDIARRFDARALAMATLRPHIAHAAARVGWRPAGVLMVKRMDLQ